MLKKFVMPLVGAVAAAVLVAPASVSAQGTPAQGSPAQGSPAQGSPAQGSPAPGDVRIAPGRFDTVRIGDSLESAAESGYFVLDLKTAGCGTRAIWPTKSWRKSIDVYQGFEEDTEGTVGTIGVVGDDISTREGIGVGSTVADLEAAYGDRLIGPRQNDLSQWSYFVRTNRRWLGFLTDASARDGQPTSDAALTFIEITKGRRPSLFRDGC